MLYGFTAFPPSLDPTVFDQVYARTLPNSTLYAQHMDQCLPWTAAAQGTAFPAWLARDFADVKRRITARQTVYVAVTPTANDRSTLAAECTETEGKERRSRFGKRLDSEVVIFAYINYVRRVADAMKPAYMNIGIEMSELALREPKRWREFDVLFRRTVDALHQSHPNIKVGLELVLQSIMDPATGRLVKPTAEYGDYVGISFYPYGSQFGEAFGAPALPARTPDQWRVPLDFLRTWTSKPIAIMETGYTTIPVALNSPRFDFAGNEALQDQFLSDLIQVARRDNYLFLVWFIPIDYSRLVDQLGSAPEWLKIWMYAGLWRPDLTPKPALRTWTRMLRNGALADLDLEAKPGDALEPVPVVATPAPKLSCLDDSSSTAPAAEGPQPEVGATAWTMQYAGDWALCSSPLAATAEAKSLNLWLRSDKEDALLLRLQDETGATYTTFVPVGSGWEEISVPLDKFAHDPATPGDAAIDPSKLRVLMLGDGKGAEGASGQRTVEVADPRLN